MIFWLILRGFLIVYALLHPMSYTPTFREMKDVIMCIYIYTHTYIYIYIYISIYIYICGKFHQYSICVCKVKNFEVFSY